MGIEKGILYRKTEALLQEYRAMQARVIILEADLAAHMGRDISETQDAAIQGMYFARQLSDMPRGNEVSDKTCAVADKWREQYGKEFHHVWKMFVLDKENLEHELRLLKQDMARIDAAINSLLPVDKDIVTLYYVDGLRWRKIARKVNYTVITCIKKRDKAIWYMSKSLFGKWKVV